MKLIYQILISIAVTQNVSQGMSQGFESERIFKEASIQLDAVIEKVFPLFGPIEEMKWAPGWNPEIIYSTTGVVDEHMIFKTKGKFEEEEDYTWVVSQFAPEHFSITYSIHTKERIWFVNVTCSTQRDKTIAKVKYTFTGLTNRGNVRNKMALEKMFENNLKDWEKAINHYIYTGRKIEE